MIRKAFYGFVIAVWIALLGTLIYWQWFDNPAIYYNEEIVAESPVSSGGTLILHSKFCQSRDVVPGSVTRKIENAFVYFLADTAAVPQAGCYDLRREIKLPSTLVLGPHTYHFDAQFRVNPIKSKAAGIKPVPFDVR